MKRITLILLLICTLPVLANDYFSLISICKADSSYHLDIAITEGYGVLISPSHSEVFEAYESGVVNVSLNDEWVELRALGTNPAPIQMAYFENVSDCTTSGVNEPALTAQDIYRAILSITHELGD
jgi:hypothetical protein